MRMSSVFASIAATALLASGAAIAAPMSNGPEPYSAPDPVYSTPHIQSSVTYNKDGKLSSNASTQSDHSRG